MRKVFSSFFLICVASFFNSCAVSQRNSYEQGGGYSNLIFLLVLIIIGLIIFFAVKTAKKEKNIMVSEDQTNKVVNVSLTGGIIGLFGSSPQNSLNRTIQKENVNGWRVVQVIPANSGNILLAIVRLLLLLITLFLFTTSNGYYVIMERAELSK